MIGDSGKMKQSIIESKWNKDTKYFKLIYNNDTTEHELHTFINSDVKKLLNYDCTLLLINYILFCPLKEFKVILNKENKLDIEILDNHFQQHKIYYDLHNKFIESKLLEKNIDSNTIEKRISDGLNLLYLNIKFTELAPMQIIDNIIGLI